MVTESSRGSQTALFWPDLVRGNVIACSGLVVLSSLGVAFLFWALHGVELRPPALPDFAGFYAGGVLAGTSSLYQERTAWELEERLFGFHSSSTVFVRPPFCALLYKVLAFYPYDVAFRIWRVGTLLALAATVWMFPVHRLFTLLLICWSLPAAFCLFGGQDTAFLLLCIAIALRLHAAQKFFLAGVLLALCLAKFYVLLFVPLLLALQRQWRVTAGLALTTTVLLALSFALQGAMWPVEYLRVLTGPESQSSPELMFNVRGACLRSPLAPYASQVHAVAGVVVTCLLWIIARRRSFRLALCCCVLGALLVSPHVYNQDYLLALPVCGLLFIQAPYLRLLAGLFAAPTTYVFSPITVLLGAALLAAVALTRPSPVGSAASKAELTV